MNLDFSPLRVGYIITKRLLLTEQQQRAHGELPEPIVNHLIPSFNVRPWQGEIQDTRKGMLVPEQINISSPWYIESTLCKSNALPVKRDPAVFKLLRN